MESDKYLKDKTVLVTGGTGSFGHAAVKRLLGMGVAQVVVFSRDEKKQFDMANEFAGSDSRLRFELGDVRDRERVNFLMRGIDVVFHAAALKQVPNCEFFPMEAILTNAVGAHNVVTAAMTNGVERVVVLSTDKAVYPINVMGMTKALGERLMIANSRESRGGTKLCGTRYGNVMYTRGSVIPFFVDLMRQGKPLRVTSPKMTRFMMSLEESIDLVLYAMANGKEGDIYVRKAPAAAIGDLAAAIADLFGYKKGIEEIGVRPGEKMHETLISSEEIVRTEDCGDYYRIKAEVPSMDMKQYFTAGVGTVALPAEGYTSANTKRLTVEETKKLLLTLPEIREEMGRVGKG